MHFFHRTHRRLATPAIVLFSMLLTACSGGDNHNTTPLSPTQSNRSFIYEREFADDARLAAQSHQTVVLNLTNSAQSDHITRHQFHTGQYQFCMEPDETILSGMTLTNQKDEIIVRLTRSGCVTVTLTDGVYQMRVGANAVGNANRIAFIRASAPSPPLVINGKPVGGWWALRPDDPTGQHRLGRVRMTPAPLVVSTLLQTDFASTQFDGASLFSFTDPHYPFVYRGPQGAISIGYAEFGAPIMSVYPLPLDFLNSPFGNMNVTDLGNYRMQFGKSTPGSATDFYLFDLKSFGLDVGPTFMGNPPGVKPAFPPTPVSVLFRFYDDGTQIGDLNEGEVALFQQCQFRGKAAVFVGDIPSLSDASSAITTLAKTASSVKLGNNTGVLLYSNAKYTGTPQAIKTETACLPGKPNTESIQVRPLTSIILISSRSCRECRLVGADLSNLDLNNLDLTKADLTGATLIHTNLSKATLTEALLKGADLGAAILNGAVLNNANLEETNFTNASLTDNASLQGVLLKNANLTKANLNGADFSNANFYGTLDAASNSGVCNTNTSTCSTIKTGFTCSCATASGANLDATKFNNAYLYGVDFSGNNSSINNVDFSNAILIASSFTGRIITGDNNSGATSSFNAAYLQGALLGNSTLGAITLQNGFVDFNHQGGNDLSIVLSQAHTQFRNSIFAGAVCVNPFYSSATTVPAQTPSNLICPDGNQYSDGVGCGSPTNPDGSGNPRWKSPLDIGRWTTPGWYDSQSPAPTFPPPTPPQPVCNGIAVSTNW